MSTEYFLEKFTTARALLRRGDRDPRDAIVRAWLEVGLGWRQADHDRPGELESEHQGLNQLFRAAEAQGLGPAFGGVHRGIFRISVDQLPDTDFLAFHRRVRGFVIRACRWAESVLRHRDSKFESDE